MVAIPERPGEDVNVLTAHLGEFGRPEMIPESVIGCVWDAGIETRLIEFPMLHLANGSRKCCNVVVWKLVAESVLGSMKQVLAIHECHDTFGKRFSFHGAKNNPARGCCQRVKRGVDKFFCSR